jgi:hypothetical protein
MTGKEAYEALREGKPIRKKDWPETARWRLDREHDLVLLKGTQKTQKYDSWYGVGYPLFASYKTDEWELYEEEVPESEWALVFKLPAEVPESEWALLVKIPAIGCIRNRKTISIFRGTGRGNVKLEINERHKDSKVIEISMEDARKMAQKLLPEQEAELTSDTVDALVDLSERIEQGFRDVVSIKKSIRELSVLLDGCRVSLEELERTLSGPEGIGRIT